MQLLSLALLFFLFACNNSIGFTPTSSNFSPKVYRESVLADSTSWAYFLQHLPETKGNVVDYKGGLVSDTDKAFALINYDVGNRDLQQCADALLRLRAEYLFSRRRYSDIGFHFTNGDYYSFNDYCNGKRPIPKGNDVVFVSVSPQASNHTSLRRYLDIVYTYAGTISLARELKPATGFGIGTVVITPGSPGHCFIITDEAQTADHKPVYKLVEGYTPAQSIYVLRNTAEPELGCWHRLTKGTIETASYSFSNYALKRFE